VAVPQDPLLFAAAPRVKQQAWELYVRLSVGLGFALLLLFWNTWNDAESWLVGGLMVFWVLYLLWESLFRPAPDLRYELTADALVVRNGRGDTRYAYAEVKAFTVQTFYANECTAYEGLSVDGHFLGTWRYKGMVYTLHATRRDRLVLIDTADGVVGISPALESEDDFVGALQRLSGLALTPPDEFAPQKARKAVALWPAYLFYAVVLTMSPQWIKTLLPPEWSWAKYLPFLLLLLFFSLFRKPLMRGHAAVPWLAAVLAVVVFVWGVGR
jgi:hypothetical protein